MLQGAGVVKIYCGESAVPDEKWGVFYGMAGERVKPCPGKAVGNVKLDFRIKDNGKDRAKLYAVTTRKSKFSVDPNLKFRVVTGRKGVFQAYARIICSEGEKFEGLRVGDDVCKIFMTTNKRYHINKII